MTSSDGQAAVSYLFDDVKIDLATYQVHKAGEIRTLAPRAFDLLIYLISYRDRVVEKAELFEKVWGETIVGDNALTRAIKEIRQAIGDEADAPRYIRTVPKRGYRFIAEVTTSTSPVLTSGIAGGIAAGMPVSEPAFARRGVSVEVSPTDLRTGEGAQTIRSTEPELRSRTVFYRSPWFALVLSIAVWAIPGWLLLRMAPDVGGHSAVVRNEQLTTWSGLDAYPRFSPDGQSIAYASDHSGSFEVYVKTLIPGARELQLTNDGQGNFEPTWSPDGKWIAYHSKNRGGIWTMPATGGTPKQVTEFGSYPSWSPDGKTLVFQSFPLTDLGATAVGAVLPSRLWTVRAMGGTPEPLTEVDNPPGGHASPSWSPSGDRVVFVANGGMPDIYVVSMATKKTDRVTNCGAWSYDPVFTPDGQSIYFGGIGQPGRFVLFKARLPKPGEGPVKPIEVLDTGLNRIKNLSLSADGRRIVYSAPAMIGQLASIPISKKTGEAAGESVNLIEDTSYRKGIPKFSPDGRKIAYVDFRGGRNQDLMVRDLDSKETVQLTTSPAGDWAPSWFPDGDRIAFQTGRLGRPSVWDVSVGSGREKLLLEVQQDIGWPTLSPDGKFIAFNSEKSGTTNVWTMPVAGGPATQLTFDKEAAGWPAWSPDGKQITFALRRGDDTHVAVIPSTGGEVKQLTFDKDQSWPSTWSPDGDKIGFSGYRNGVWNVYWLSLSTGKQTRLTNHKSHSAFVRYAEWSPLGNQVVYEYTETKGNIWLLELK